jgi:type IV pilus assembly protein PilV
MPITSSIYRPFLPPNAGQRGFSLLEVLVTIVVVAIGLLGVAGMQITAIKLADTADMRSKASVNMEGIIERILTNPNNAAAYAVSYTGTVSNGPAVADVATWKTGLAANLLNGQGSIDVTPDASCPTIASSVCRLVTVTVRWTEARAKRSATGATPQLVEFKTVVRV